MMGLMKFGGHQVCPWGVDEMLVLSKKFKVLSDRFREDWVPSDDEDQDDGSGSETCEHEEDLTAGEAEPIGDSGTGKDQDYGVEAIRNVRVYDQALRQSKGTSSCPHVTCLLQVRGKLCAYCTTRVVLSHRCCIYPCDAIEVHVVSLCFLISVTKDKGTECLR